jgi:ubiquinone/menaquinone biosynthesis C-methylase UbiE
MTEPRTKKMDFDNPSLGFRLEDKLKWLLGGPLLYNKFIRTFNLNGSESVLDFGCGGGTGSKGVLKYLGPNGKLTCLDASRYWVNIVRKRLQKHTNVRFINGDIRELDIPNSIYDVIFMVYVLHDIEPEIRQETISALASKLKKNGRLYLAEPTGSGHGMPAKEIRRLLSNAGLKEINNRSSNSRYVGEYQKI